MSTRDHYHCSNHPADIDGVTSVLNVHPGVFQGFFGVVQDFKTDVHHIVLKLRERESNRSNRTDHKAAFKSQQFSFVQ